MAKRKIKIKRIENAASRQVTFTKRRTGLLKKAHDLSVLCDAEVAVIIFSGKGKLFQFASPSMRNVLKRYSRSCGDWKNDDSAPKNGGSRNWATDFIEKLKNLQSTLVGNNLEGPSLLSLIQLEQQLRNSLGCIRARKEMLFNDQLQDIQEKITVIQKELVGNSNMVAKVTGLTSSEVTGSQNSGADANGIDGLCLGCYQSDRSLLPQPDICANSALGNHSPQLLPAAKPVVIFEDLNKSPPHCQDFS